MPIKKAPHKLMRSIATNMIKRREQLGMRQIDLANAAKVSKAIISLIESGKRADIHLETLYNLSLGLHCEVHELLYGLVEYKLKERA